MGALLSDHTYAQPDPNQPPMPGGVKGFFGALFDLSFTHFVTPMVVKVVYVLGLIVLALSAPGVFIIGLVLLFQGEEGGPLLVIGAPIVALLYLCLLRMTLEFYVAVVRMSQDIHQRLPSR